MKSLEFRLAIFVAPFLLLEAARATIEYLIIEGVNEYDGKLFLQLGQKGI